MPLYGSEETLTIYHPATVQIIFAAQITMKNKSGGLFDEQFRLEDIDAAWLKKNGENFYGHKGHIKADTETELITDYEVTAASVHDSEALYIENLLDKKDQGQPFYADSAYRSEAIEKSLKRKKIESQIHEKG